MSLDGPVRRIVTTHDKTGKAIALIDAEVPADPKTDATSWHLWVTDASPAKTSGTNDFAAKHKFHPPKNGTQFRIVEFRPTPDASTLDPQFIIKTFGLHKLAARGRPVRHPLMHRSASVDYAIVLSGEIDMLLDEGEYRVKAGDIIIQQATNHAWINRGTKPCRIAFILMDGKDPLEKRSSKRRAKKSPKKSAARKTASKKAARKTKTSAKRKAKRAR